MGLHRVAREVASMTDKRDLKRRVRDRQARTGESYMTALRQVRAQRPRPVPVVELVDLSEVGARFGMKCRIAMLPALAERFDPARLLERLRDALLATEGDPTTALMRAVVFRGEQSKIQLTSDLLDESRRFLERARAGIGGVSESGRTLAMSMEGKRGTEIVLCLLWLTPTFVYVSREPSLVITSLDDAAVDPVLEWSQER